MGYSLWSPTAEDQWAGTANMITATQALAAPDHASKMVVSWESRHDHMGTGRIYVVVLLVSGWWDALPHLSHVWVGSNPMWAETRSTLMLSTPPVEKADGNGTPKPRKGLHFITH